MKNHARALTGNGMTDCALGPVTFHPVTFDNCRLRVRGELEFLLVAMSLPLFACSACPRRARSDLSLLGPSLS